MFRIIPRQNVFHFKGYLKTILNKRIPVEEFEDKLTRQLKVENVTATGSATLSLYLILKNIKKSKDDEVILSGYNYYDLVNVIKYCGMKPVFVDIDEKTLLMNIDEVKERINKNTRAILVTHLFGFYNDVNRIKKLANKKIIIIEDCTHIFPSKLTGDFSIFSFNKWKTINCLGGGAIASRDKNKFIMSAIREEIKGYPDPARIEMLKRLLFNYAVKSLLLKYIFGFFVFPTIYLFGLLNIDILFDLTKDDLKNKFSENKKLRFTKLQAAIGLRMLDEVGKLDEGKKEKYKKLKNMIKNDGVKTIDSSLSPVFFPIIVKDKKGVCKKLLKHGIDSIRKYYGYSFSKNLEDNQVLLPIHHEINDKDINYMASVLNSIR